MDKEELDLTQISFQLILHSGNAKSYAMEAVEKSRSKAFEECDKLMLQAEEELELAHNSQTDLLTQFASGENILSNVLLTHAQDHLTMATLSIDFGKEIIMLRKER